jgi:signal transduction histidine kinase
MTKTDKKQSLPQVNILMVDDREENLAALEAILSDLGQNLVRASSGRAALRYLLEQDFAVILLDVQMPDMDGFETATLIKARERSQLTPIIFLTANSNDASCIFRGYSVGAVDYVTKPFVPEILKAKVKIFIELFYARHEIQMQTQELHAQNLRLENVNKELEAFADAASHDLRAPLRTIHGFSKIVMEDYGDKLDAQGKDYLKRIVAGVDEMQALIHDLLQLSRITQSEMCKESFDLSALAEDVIYGLMAREPERQVETVIAPKIYVHGDRRLLRIALENLLSNAWKFSARQTSAKIEFGMTTNDSKQIYFVRDNGAGFDMAAKERLFQPFSRLHAQSEFAGTGIGLVTVHRVINRHGGNIWATGAVDKGATFYFTLA